MKLLPPVIMLLFSAFPAEGGFWQETGTESTATFAGGCFWCMQPPFDKLDGVISTVVGYTGGTTPNPTYEEVSEGGTGYVEAIKIVYNPQKITYEKLLEVFWRNIDPTARNRQFCDVGTQYRSIIFYKDERQKHLAEKSKLELLKTRFKEIATEILPTQKFYAAEDYHQEFYKKDPIRYNFYHDNCGRDQILDELWKE